MGSIDFNFSSVLARVEQFGFLGGLGDQAGNGFATLIKGFLPPVLFLACVFFSLNILWHFVQLLPGFLVRTFGTEKLTGPSPPTMAGFKSQWFDEKQQFGP
jgi:hypothetical protein